jgi:AcrR family transcriptional regulator
MARATASLRAREAPRLGRNRTPTAQRIGAKGANTRRQLIEATARLVEERGMNRLRVADVAREAGVSQATFYVYFEDLEEAALAVLEDLSQSTPRLLRSADRRGSKDQAVQHARAMIDAYSEYYQNHRGLFLARNLAADSGDERFLSSRLHSVSAIQNIFAERIIEMQSEGRIPTGLHAHSVAGLLISLMERLGATASLPPQMLQKGVKAESLKDAAAYVVAAVLNGCIVFDGDAD